MRGYIERRAIPGAVTLVACGHEVHVDVLGARAFATGAAMTRDTIFRIASMTKPMTAAVAMTLVEEAVLRLDDPVDAWLPELANRRVLRTPTSPIDDTVPARRAITVRDLLTFRLGYGALFTPPGAYPIQQAMLDAGVSLPMPPAPTFAPDAWLGRLAGLPLVHQPGDGWLYHHGSDVLAILIARATGRDFAAVMRERLFEPLGMRDTGFFVEPAALDRFASVYVPDPRTGELELHAEADGVYTRPPVFAGGGGGLVSTADDCLAFGRMMRGLGRHAGTQILARPTVEAMITSQVEPAQLALVPFASGYWDAHGWGLGMSVVTRRAGVDTSPGRFGWDGAFGTSWYVDPREDLIAILMIQRFGNPLASKINQDFLTLVYQALGA
jgi:CubicO group peptidase (beta-lactamase class C family)